MIIKQIAYSVAKCFECNSFIIYKPGSDGFPNVCEKCGVRYDVHLTQEQRMQMERMKQHPGHHTTMNVHTIKF